MSNLSHCFQCASRRDRVGYVAQWRRSSSSPLKHGNVGEFVEHLKIELGGFLIPRFQPMYRPLRRLFLAIEEHRLIDSDARKPDQENAETEFDMSSLLKLQLISHATSCLVLMLEVVVAWHLRRTQLL
ncbi:hypothetical protein MTO96_052034 [Rhipicephalus appendiculatus]